METGQDTCLWPNTVFDGFSWSPNSRQVAVVQGGGVYVYNFDADTLYLISDTYGGFSPSWSPCGDKLVFFDRFKGVGMQIYDFIAGTAMRIDGEEQTLAGDWMPDCSTLVVTDSCDGAPCKLYAYNIYTDSLWLLSDLSGYKTNLAVSPDGKAVVFTVRYNLWAVSTMGGEPYQLTTEGGGYPDWSPDGKWIIYTKQNWWDGYLWLMRPDGSEKHQLTF
jgi:Tol biopolymer transport system component